MSAHGDIQRVIRDVENCARSLKAGKEKLALNGMIAVISDLRGIESDVKRLEKQAKP